MSALPTKITKTINFIMAISADNIIGLNNQIPWKIKEDLKHFKNLTTSDTKTDTKTDTISNMVIMGMKTFESMGSVPLPNRLNIVLTSKYESMKNQENLLFLSNLSNALYYGNLCQNIQNIWIIGGKKLFESIDIIAPDNVYMSRIGLKIFDDLTKSESVSVSVTISESVTEPISKITIDQQFFDFLDLNYNISSLVKSVCYDHISNSNVDVEFIKYEKNKVIFEDNDL